MYGHPCEFIDAARTLYETSSEARVRQGILELVQQSRGLFIEDAHLAAAWPHFPDPGLDALGFLIP